VTPGAAKPEEDHGLEEGEDGSSPEPEEGQEEELLEFVLEGDLPDLDEELGFLRTG
jgi:hypothetical protein